MKSLEDLLGSSRSLLQRRGVLDGDLVCLHALVDVVVEVLDDSVTNEHSDSDLTGPEGCLSIDSCLSGHERIDDARGDLGHSRTNDNTGGLLGNVQFLH